MKTSLSSSTKPPIRIDSRRTYGHLSVVPEAAPTPVVPGRRYTKAEIRQHRRNVVGAIAAVVGAGALIAMLVPRSTSAIHEAVPTRDEATVCEVGPGTQEFYFANGDGKNAAILAIKGSGMGIGDPCWSEAEHAVTDAISEASHGNYTEPQYDGKPILIPTNIAPVAPTPTHED